MKSIATYCFLIAQSSVSFADDSVRPTQQTIASIPVTSTELTPGSHVAVCLRSGRILKGQVDSRTTASHVWLSTEREGIRVGSQIDVREVAGIHLAAPLQLPPLLDCSALSFPSAPRHPFRFNSWSRDHIESLKTSPIRRPRPHRVLNNPQAIKAIDVIAYAANWNGNSQPDGIRALISPRSVDRELVVASGSVTCSLSVYRGDWRSQASRQKDEERWSSQIRAIDFTSEGIVVELPFRKIRPDVDRDLLPLADLKVRLSVPNVGTFDAQVDDVPLRSMAYTRDLRQDDSTNGILLPSGTSQN